MSMSTAPHELYAQWSRLPSERQFLVGALVGISLLLLAPYLPIRSLSRGTEVVSEALVVDAVAESAPERDSLFKRAGAAGRSQTTNSHTPDLREVEQLLN